MKEFDGVMHSLAAQSLRGVFADDEYDRLAKLDSEGAKLVRQDFLEANEEGLDIREYHRRIGAKNLKSYSESMKARFLNGWDK
jgi:hypothetical protein